MKNYLYTLSLIFLASCNIINPLYDEGEYIETSIEVGDFTQLEVHNIFNIEIIDDTETYVLYKGGENILEQMHYTTENNTLKLDHKFINWANNYKMPTLEIHVPEIEKIHLYSSGYLSSLNQLSGERIEVSIHEEASIYEIDLKIKYASLYFHSQGSASGTIAFSGECTLATYTLNGSTNIQASDLITERIGIVQNSLGDAHIYVENMIRATFYKSGNIYYKGNPEDIEVEYKQINNQDASGKLIPE